ncbi:hypothetical protein SDC9_201819 [bioreactor metagenome]|uniref:Uncharacterized protein n=1 Tax=bioreactor metagenome TaxID=1076179 RepID=A0A645ITC9_9ZZZZ
MIFGVAAGGIIVTGKFGEKLVGNRQLRLVLANAGFKPDALAPQILQLLHQFGGAGASRDAFLAGAEDIHRHRAGQLIAFAPGLDPEGGGIGFEFTDSGRHPERQTGGRLPGQISEHCLPHKQGRRQRRRNEQILFDRRNGFFLCHSFVVLHRLSFNTFQTGSKIVQK